MNRVLLIVVLLCSFNSCEDMQKALPSQDVLEKAVKAEDPGDVVEVVKFNIEEKKALQDTSTEASAGSDTDESESKPSWLQLALSSLLSAIVGAGAVYVKKKGVSLPV